MKGNHKYFMRKAFELARRGEGLTRPNPPVGALLVKDGDILASGWHEKAGGPHAEAACLNQSAFAGVDLSGATLYVTLEPCSSAGRTPPCTDLIIKRGVGRVVVSVLDPNQKHSGRGLEILKRSGVCVECGVSAGEGEQLIRPFRKYIRTGMPYVTLKMASTLDGRIADAEHRSKWIAGAGARERVQDLRRRSDAVMVGAETVVRDNPSLLPRPAEGRRPWRVVLDPQGRVPADSRVLNDCMADQTIIFRLPGSGTTPESDSRVRFLEVPARAGLLSLRDVLRKLGDLGVMHLLCEGGGVLAGSLLDEELVDAGAFFVAPKFLGADAVPLIGGRSRSLGDAWGWSFESLERVGEDILIRAVPESSSGDLE